MQKNLRWLNRWAALLTGAALCLIPGLRAAEGEASASPGLLPLLSREPAGPAVPETAPPAKPPRTPREKIESWTRTMGDFVVRPLGEVAISEAETLAVEDIYQRLAGVYGQTFGREGTGDQRRGARVQWTAELEEFVTQNPESAWTPALHVELGAEYLRRLNYSQAIRHYETAHAKTSHRRTDTRALEIASEAARQWGQLLVTTGDLESFDVLFASVKQWDTAPLAVTWLSARERRAWIEAYPAEAAKCGLQCLDQLGKLIQPNAYSPGTIYYNTPATLRGFNAEELVRIGSEAGLAVRALRLESTANLPVPSIAHLAVGHFVVLRQREGAFYEVVDPLLGAPRWLTAAELAGELSGAVIVSEELDTRPFGRLERLEAEQARQFLGRCFHGTPWETNGPPPCTTCPCPPSPGGSGTGTGTGSGSGTGGCSLCFTGLGGPQRLGAATGMPVWWIEEPQLNLWVSDTPLLYEPAVGPTVELTVRYKTRSNMHYTHQRGVKSIVEGFYYNHWFCSWLSWVRYDTDSALQATVFLPEGGSMLFAFPSGQNLSHRDYWTQWQLEKKVTSGQVTGFWLLKPDGSRIEYGYQRVFEEDPWTSVPIDSSFLMTAQRDPQGLATTFAYVHGGFLDTVTAADGVEFAVTHEDQGSLDEYLSESAIVGVTSDVGLTTSFEYGGTEADPAGLTHWELSGITDSAGITSYLAIPIGGVAEQPAYIRTPYGRTTIIVGGVKDSTDFDPGTVERYVDVTHPDGSQEAWAAMTDYAGMDWPDWAGGQIPDTSAAVVNTLDTDERQSRNTFHWSPNARANMATDLSYLFANEPWDLDWTDIKQSRISHWLTHTEDYYTHWGTFSWVQDPSPDGSTEGAVLWYDYAGKPGGANENRGTSALPAVEARRMPDTTTWFRSYTRNAAGKPTQIVERWHNGSGYVTRTNSFTYDSNLADVLTATDPGGHVTRYAYDGAHPFLPVRMTNALNEVTFYTYDGDDRLHTVKYPSGLTVSNVWGGDDRLAARIEWHGSTKVATNTYTHVFNQVLTRSSLNSGTLTNWTRWVIETDPRGLTVTNAYDALARPYERWSYGLVEQWHYELWPGQNYTASGGSGGKLLLDPTGVIRIVGGTNYSTNTWTYDAIRRVAYAGDPAGTLTAYEYCDCGGPSKVTLGHGLGLAETTTNSYNHVGWKTGVAYPGFGSVSHEYDLLGRLIKTTDALGSTTNVYDNLNRLVQVKNAFGTIRSLTYDSEDMVLTVTDANGVTTTSTYDALHRLKTRTLTGGVAEQWFYTSNVHGPTSYTNQIGKETQWTYDAAGRKTNEVVVGVMTNRFVYNGAGDLTDLYDGNQVGGSNRTQWRYDAYGRVAHKVYANNQTNLTYTYNLLGQLATRWSQAKGSTAYLYDRKGNLTNVNYPSSVDLRFQFDALNRTTNMIDAAGTTKFTYAHGLPATEDGPWTTDVLTWSYNNARQRSQLVISQPTGNAWTNTYAYDSARRLSSVVSPAGTFGYQFNGAGSLVTKLTQPSGFWITNTFDSRARLIDTTLYDNTSTILNRHGYALNHAHQRTTVTRTNYASTAYNRKVDYTYDNAGEVRTARAYDGGGAAVAAENFDYGYDAGWNILKRTNNTTVTSYTLNNLNQITADGGASWTHDSNGNLTYHPTGGTGDLSYTYDDENQLLSVISSGAYKHEFTYDGRGRVRVRKDYGWYSPGSTWLLSTEIRYLYDGMVIVQERNSSGHPTVTYTRGTDLSGSLSGAGGIGGLLSRGAHSGSSPYQLSTSAHYHADGNGNVTMLVGSGSPSIKAYYKFDPFGRTLASGGSLATANAMRFSSKPVIGTSGLYYYGYRFYDSNTQRWLNRDPIFEKGGRNIYGFVGNNPILALDPDGRWYVPKPAPPPVTLCEAVAYTGFSAGILIGEFTGASQGLANLLVPDVDSSPLPCPRPRPRPASDPKCGEQREKTCDYICFFPDGRIAFIPITVPVSVPCVEIDTPIIHCIPY